MEQSPNSVTSPYAESNETCLQLSKSISLRSISVFSFYPHLGVPSVPSIIGFSIKTPALITDRNILQIFVFQSG
jgi:hypothetical protein